MSERETPSSYVDDISDYNSDEDYSDYIADVLLHNAVKENNETIVECLLYQGADPNLPIPMTESTALGNGQYTNPKMHEILRSINTLSNTFTGYASNKIGIPWPRVSSNADIHPMHPYVAHRHWRCPKGARRMDSESSNTKNVFLLGPKALHHAAAIGNPKIIKMLIANRADVDSPMEGGYTPLAIAILQEFFFVAKLLIIKGASVNARFGLGKTPLHLAVESSQINMVLLLLDRGANVNSVTVNGSTPLHIAVKRKILVIIELLLECGANVNSIDNNEATPLHYASAEAEQHIIEMLLKYGADPSAIMNNGVVDISPLNFRTVEGKKKVQYIIDRHQARFGNYISNFYGKVVTAIWNHLKGTSPN